MPIIETPFVDKLPESLYGDTFTLAEKEKGLYLFVDKTWIANSSHILGWSREIIHSLTDLEPAEYPNWLGGHAFQKLEDNTYRISGTETIVTDDQLVTKAKEAANALEDADIHTDPLGNRDLASWKENLIKQLPKTPEVTAALKVLSPLQLFTARMNHANEQYHPEYPSQVKQQSENKDG